MRFDGSAEADVGLFSVLPDQKRVFYQRRMSSFARALTDVSFPWADILGTGDVWYHATGITPLCSENAYVHWNQSLVKARELGVPIRCGVGVLLPSVLAWFGGRCGGAVCCLLLLSFACGSRPGDAGTVIVVLSRLRVVWFSGWCCLWLVVGFTAWT